MIFIVKFFRTNQNQKRKMLPQKWPTNDTSCEYVTDEMLTPFLPASLLPTSQIELSLSCRNLYKANILSSKLDPFCKVMLEERVGQRQNQFKEIARTEVIKDTSDPEWVEKVALNYNFETIQRIRFEILDAHERDTDALGFFETTISELVSFTGNQSIGKLQGSSRLNSEIVIVTEEVKSCKQIVDIQFRVENLQSNKWFGNINPFLVLSRSNEDKSFSVVAKTEPICPPQESTWKPITIRATRLCNGDFERKIKIDCYDHRKNGSHKLMGTCFTSMSRLNEDTESMILIDEEKQKSDPNYGPTGELKLEKIVITDDITFLDYIRNGTQIHFSVAIDFTASNGVHTNPKSLHYLSTIPNELNQYEIALSGVGEIMEYYDRSKLFPAFGKKRLS